MAYHFVLKKVSEALPSIIFIKSHISMQRVFNSSYKMMTHYFYQIIKFFLETKMM